MMVGGGSPVCEAILHILGEYVFTERRGQQTFLQSAVCDAHWQYTFPSTSSSVKVAEFPKLALKHGILLNLPI